MECDRYPENAQGVSSPAAWACGVKRKLAGGLRLGPAGARGAGAALLARGPRRRASPRPEPRVSPRPEPRASPRPEPRASPRPSPRAPLPRTISEPPFMSSMDEITYWIVTKRAPCLAALEPVRPSACTSPDPEPKKKKRKVITVDDDSETTERIERPNAFSTPNPKCEILSSEKSDTLVSDVDFNIKKSSVQAKNKKKKNQRNNLTTLHKKNKVITSTPDVASSLRRSLRKAQCNINNNSQFNNTFDILTMANGNEHPNTLKHEAHMLTEQSKSPNLAGGDQNNKKKNVSVQRSGNRALNGQFEDLSDVSGFTANYIKSTKINSKTPRKLRANKQSRNLTKRSRQSIQKEEKSLIVSISKGINTGDPQAAILNCSTDSSQNVINLVTMTKDSKSSKVDQSTSLLKFVDTKGGKDVRTNRGTMNGALNTSFQSSSTMGSRYPKRNKTSTEVTAVDNSEKTDPSKLNFEKRKTIVNNQASSSIVPTSCQSENIEVRSKTRSGRSVAQKHTENSVFVFSDATEPMSSEVTMNVADPVKESRDSLKKKRVSSKCARSKKSLNKTEQSTKYSFREASGFSACFSDSDDDKPLKPQKYLS